MTEKHTPGPWKAVEYRGGMDIRAGDITLFISAGNGHNITHAKPNACLIAAAPDLLETLRHILSLADENAKGVDGYELISQWASKAIDRTTGQNLSRAEVITAIARAT